MKTTTSWSGLSLLLLLDVLSFSSSANAAVSKDPGEPKIAPNFTAPPLHYSSLSFRGLNEHGKIPTFDVSGHATPLPSIHDFIRLTPSFPLAYGAIFSTKPLEAEEWVAEVAFRVHGAAAVGLTETLEDGSIKRMHKGGRGLAFWYTKEGLPGPVTISNNPKTKIHDPPPPQPRVPVDISDPQVSLFGSRVKFEGLGVVFDTSPAAPLWRRSHTGNYAHPDQRYGVGTTGVVSGIMSDGATNWLDSDTRQMKLEDEAGYLEKAFGECEAGFRNAQGLLWARISYINHTVRVDLDLAPHTTLQKAGRDYAHNCFFMDNVKLPSKGYLGVSGLAAGNTEPDSIDIYAVDVFTVTPGEAASPDALVVDDAPEVISTHVLEGTANDAEVTLVQEIFLSQSKMMEAIDALTRRIDALSSDIRSTPRGQSGQAPVGAPLDTSLMNSRLAKIEAQLDHLAALRPGDQVAPATGTNEDVKEKLTHLLQLQDKVMVELSSFGKKLDATSGASSANLATISSRNLESIQMLRSLLEVVENQAKKAIPMWMYIGAVGAIGVLGYEYNRRKKNHAWADERKYL